MTDRTDRAGPAFGGPADGPPYGGPALDRPRDGGAPVTVAGAPSKYTEIVTSWPVFGAWRIVTVTDAVRAPTFELSAGKYWKSHTVWSSPRIVG